MMMSRAAPPMPTPMPTFAPVERLWGVEVDVGDDVAAAVLSFPLAFRMVLAIVDTAAPTVDGDGFAFALIRIASVG